MSDRISNVLSLIEHAQVTNTGKGLVPYDNKRDYLHRRNACPKRKVKLRSRFSFAVDRYYNMFLSRVGAEPEFIFEMKESDFKLYTWLRRRIGENYQA